MRPAARIGAWFVLSLLLGGNAQAQSAGLDPESQLTAIRQALIEATLDRPTKVSASAWIDDKGQLRETAHFQSDAKIRGVRVLSYMEDGQSGTPKAQIQMENLPWSIRMAKAGKGETCEPAPHPWRQPLVISSQNIGGFKGPELYASTQLLQQIELSFLRMAEQSGRWSVSSSKFNPTDTYQKYWLGRGEEPSGWHLSLQLLPVKNAETQPRFWSAWFASDTSAAPSRWTLQAIFGQRSQTNGPIQAIWQRQLVIDANGAADLSADRWIRQIMNELEKVFIQWLPNQAHDTACETVQFSVTRTNAQNWVLQAGAGSGLKVGDRVLVLNAARVPGRLLEPGTSQQLAIAEVVRVGRHQSDLKPLAGTAAPATGDWVALPL